MAGFRNEGERKSAVPGDWIENRNGRRIVPSWRSGAGVRKGPAHSTGIPGGELEIEIDIITFEMQDRIDSNSRWRSEVLDFRPCIPIGIGEGIVIRCRTVSPFRVRGAGEMREEGLRFGVVNTLTIPARNPDMIGKVILICCGRGIGQIRFAEVCLRAGPDGCSGEESRSGRLCQKQNCGQLEGGGPGLRGLSNLIPGVAWLLSILGRSHSCVMLDPGCWFPKK